MGATKTISVAVFLLFGAAIILSLTQGPKGQRTVKASGGAQVEEKRRSGALTTLHKNLFSTQLRTRLQAARALAVAGQEESLPFLINALADPQLSNKRTFPESAESAVAYWANKALLRITGRDFGFSFDADNADRENAILRWRRWYSSKKRVEETVASVTEGEDKMP